MGINTVLLNILSLAITSCLAVSVTDIQGPAFLSPLHGQNVKDVQEKNTFEPSSGIVTAKGSSGFWIQGSPSPDVRISCGVSVFTSSKSILSKVAIGDLITLSGTVNEFHSDDTVLSVTEIDSPTNITILSHNHTVEPLIVGKRRIPPTAQYSALDHGDFFSVPNNSSQIEVVNATLQPDKYGIDFWESLEGQLITVEDPSVLDFENGFGVRNVAEIWVYGKWPVLNKNSRGGLTITTGSSGLPNANPEVIIIGEPLDGTSNPSVAIGTKLTTVTGVVHYQFGFYYILPLTAPKIVSSISTGPKPTKINPNTRDICTITLGDYNVDNLAPNSSHLPLIATHIAQFLRNPDLVHLQEIQDNNGEANDGTVDATVTLQTLVNAIKKVEGVEYSFIDVNPVNNEDGGASGGNIRQAYIYRPDRIRLAGNSPPGGSLDATKVIFDKQRQLGLTLNPGRIEPNNTAWTNSRKSLAAVWERVGGNGARLFTINVHQTAKTGSSSEQGNLRSPINQDVSHRIAQVQLTADFVKSILKDDPFANVVVAGDFNEFVQTTAVFKPFNSILREIDEVAGIPAVERYTYVFDMNMEQLDHIFISNTMALRPVEVEHVHVNQWAANVNDRASDHDPSVASFKIC
ncbi:hypothetical protein Clacol_007561 [Clathrus columnatus]|uniref:Endonuclease/exonuclease/phosphatase domain-containing protein n=1 Tax=Clathrus columnatus TaxID=1419009 RepID=A0AAV5AJJ8_9AGAM|nr:hypothetical protein Clacol_007561 [Clathrus columnatus]